ncbi:hypothetical protein PTMSG1_02320 [Pyrenophora teres f. maculata]|nr:hypothetical protein PTMSG1_02320 [Pyrenophora teres f. maculata]
MHLPTHKLQFRQKSATSSPEATTNRTATPGAPTPIPTPAVSHTPHPPPPAKSRSFNIKNKYNVQTGVSVLQNVSRWTDKAALTPQKHGNYVASKQTGEKHQVQVTTMSGDTGRHTTEVSRETIIHQQTEVSEKPDITTGVQMRSTGVRRETVVYKEPESTENSGTTEQAKMDKKTKPISVLSNSIETRNILKSENHNMTASTTQSDCQPREMTLVTEAHELHGHEGGDKNAKHMEHMEHDTDSEHEYPDTSDDDDEHSEEYEYSGDEESVEEDDSSEEEDEEVKSEQKPMTALSAHK